MVFLGVTAGGDNLGGMVLRILLLGEPVEFVPDTDNAAEEKNILQSSLVLEQIIILKSFLLSSIIYSPVIYMTANNLFSIDFYWTCTKHRMLTPLPL